MSKFFAKLFYKKACGCGQRPQDSRGTDCDNLYNNAATETKRKQEKSFLLKLFYKKACRRP
ncbi:MAG: hypothetical protein ACI4W6_08505, partial [Acutalibacteraceae bacterium]